MRNVYTHLKTLVLTCLLTTFISSRLEAQVSGYGFSYSSGTYTPITGGSVLGVATNDDTSFPNLPIGFTFNYNGANYTAFSVNSNGFIAMGTAVTSSYNPLSTGTSNNVISAFGGDLQGNTGSGELRYETIGAAPNRVLVVQWASYRSFGATGDNYNFQIRLHETTGRVEVQYGTVGQNATNRTRQLGLRGNTAADFNNRTTTTSWATTTAGANNGATCTLTTTIVPVNGSIFRWDAPPANPATPVQLGGTPTCTLGAQLGFSTTALSCTASATASGNDNAATTATVNDFSCATGAVTSATLDASIGANCPSWYTYSIVVNGVTVASNQCNQTGFDLTPYLPLTSVSVVSADAPGDGGDFITLNLTVNLNYSVPFSLPADVVYYWQTTPTGTSQATPHVDPYFVPANGTYYVRAYNTVTGLWSVGSSSITVTNFPLAPAPPAPVAALNPSCAPTGTTVSVDAAPVGTTYYWQGTTANGTSTAEDASTPLAVTSSGTYHVSAFESTSGCWSSSSSVDVTVDNIIPPAPVVDPEFFNFCSGATTAIISASTPVSEPGSCTVTASASGLDINGVTATANDFSCVGVGVVTSATLNATIGGNCPSWYFYSIVVNGVTVAIQQCNQTGFDLTPYLPLSSVAIVAANAPGDSQDNVTLNLTVTLNYVGPTYSLAWYDASTSGTQLGSGENLETIGTSVLPTATLGSYEFFVETIQGGCSSATREVVTVNIADVNAELIPVDATCNGGDNGSFTLGAVQCGTEPFLYSVDGGDFGSIPSDLTAGTYSVVIEDNAGLLSSPITVIVGQPAPPADLTASNILYFSADISWTTTGNETSWTVEYGPSGFTPGTGTVLVVSTGTDTTLTGLTENTSYDFYVTANCGALSESTGPANFSTNTGFFTYDNQCGPGFVDISTTGTPLNLSDDGTTIVTSGFPLSYQGITSDQVTISNNGWIQIGGFAGVQMNVWNNDWDSETGNVYHQTFNDGTTNWFIVQWEDRPRFPGVVGQSVTFQVLVNETTSEVFYIYEDVVVGGSQSSNDFGGQGTIGFQGPEGNTIVSSNNTAYLTNNSCVRWYFALCPDPILVSTQVFQEEVILDWDAGLYGETEWTLIYGESGFDPTTEGTTLTLNTSDANILGLTQVTDYDVYIYSECTLDDLTSGGLLVEFQTLPWCNNVTNITTSTAVDSLFAGWDWVPVDGATNGGITGFNIQYGPTGFDLYNEGTILSADGLNFADTVYNETFLAGGVYQVYIQSVCGVDTSNYAGPVTFVMPLTNDAVCSPEALSVDGTMYTFNNAGATVEADENTIAPATTNANSETGWANSTLNNTTWFTFVAPASGQVRINNTALNYNGQAAVYSANDCSDWTSFEIMAANDNSMLSASLAPNFSVCGLTPGATYYLMHDGFNATTGNYSISITPIVLNAGTIVDVMDVCSGGSVELFDGITGYDNDGVWSAELPSAETQLTGSEWNSAGFAYEIFNFEYRLTDGCAFDTTFAKVRVWAPSNAGTDGSLTVCRNQPFDLLAGLNGTVDLGGTWFNPSLQELSSSAIVASNIPGQFNYYYVAGNGICPNDTSLVLVNVQSTCDYLDVEEMYFGTMTIMPNPSNGVFNINNTGSTEVFNYTVTDVDGRVILTKDTAINGTETTVVDLTDMVTGIYMIRVYNDNAEKVFRVIKQ